MNEIWKLIEGYEGKYMVSNLGRVKSLNYRQTGKEKILKPKKNIWGYLTVVLSSNNKCKEFKIHRLVANAFISNPDNLPQVNHKDENKENNCVTNLEWCTIRYNVCYGTRNEKVSKALSKKVACYKDKKLIKVYAAIKDVDNDGFCHQNVSSVCHEKRKSHAGYQWSFVD